MMNFQGNLKYRKVTTGFYYAEITIKIVKLTSSGSWWIRIDKIKYYVFDSYNTATKTLLWVDSKYCSENKLNNKLSTNKKWTDIR